MTLPEEIAGQLSIVYARLDQLKDHPQNPKNHSLKDLRESFERFGFAEAITVDGRTGLLVSGHGRVKVLRAMEHEGSAPPSGVLIEPSPDGGHYLVPVQVGWESKDDDEALAFLLAANELTIKAGWIPDLLSPALAQIAVSPMAYIGTGFSSEDLVRLTETTTFRVNDDSDPGTHYDRQYAITVMCEDESSQQRLYDRFVAEGLDCRPVVT